MITTSLILSTCALILLGYCVYLIIMHWWKNRPIKEPNTIDNHNCAGDDMWPNFISLINHLGVSYTLLRPDLFYWQARNELDASMETMDTYRNLLTKAGYLTITERGKYKVLKRVPKNLSLMQAREEAYGNGK